jgi:hypothetical protein
MMDKLPGEDFAKENGYETFSYAGNRKSASYVKETKTGHVFLDIEEKLNIIGEFFEQGKLTKIFGCVACTLGPFSLPNKNFAAFESQMLSIVQIQEG